MQNIGVVLIKLRRKQILRETSVFTVFYIFFLLNNYIIGFLRNTFITLIYMFLQINVLRNCLNLITGQHIFHAQGKLNGRP